jgi:hypothetical protein
MGTDPVASTLWVCGSVEPRVSSTVQRLTDKRAPPRRIRHTRFLPTRSERTLDRGPPSPDLLPRIWAAQFGQLTKLALRDVVMESINP